MRDLDTSSSATDSVDLRAHCQTRYFKGHDRYPLWCEITRQCLARGPGPANLLKPEDIQDQIDVWIDEATADSKLEEGKEELKAFCEFSNRVSDATKDLRSVV